MSSDEEDGDEETERDCLVEEAEEDKETERKSRRSKALTHSKKKNMDYDEENAADIEDADERGEEELEESPETTQRANEKKLKGIYKEDIHDSSQGALKSVDQVKRKYHLNTVNQRQ